MSILKKAAIFALAIAGFLPALNSEASVSLALAGNPVTKSGTSTTVTAGQSFTVSVELISTTSASTDTVYGVDYFLNATGPSAGVFTLTGRDAVTNGGSNPFSVYSIDDHNAGNTGVLDNVAATGFGARLNPSNNVPLGAGVSNIALGYSNNYPNGTGTFNPQLVATYTIAVDPAAAGGNYTLSILPPASGGYSYFDSTTFLFFDASLSSTPAASPITGSFTVNVVPLPEPSSALLLGIGGLLAMRRRRK